MESLIPTRKQAGWLLALLVGLPSIGAGWMFIGLPVPATRDALQSAQAATRDALESRIDAVDLELKRDLASTDKLARSTAIAFWQATLTDRLRDVVDVQADMNAFQRRGEGVPAFYRDLEQNLLEDVRRARQKLRELGVEP